MIPDVVIVFSLDDLVAHSEVCCRHVRHPRSRLKQRRLRDAAGIGLRWQAVGVLSILHPCHRPNRVRAKRSNWNDLEKKANTEDDTKSKESPRLTSPLWGSCYGW